MCLECVPNVSGMCLEYSTTSSSSEFDEIPYFFIIGRFGDCVWNLSGMCLGLILSPECLWIILNVSGMLGEASESVW